MRNEIEVNLAESQTNEKNAKSIQQFDAGIGLRFPHVHQIVKEKPDIPWLEVSICEFLSSPSHRQLLENVAEHYLISFHGSNLNIGGVDPLDDMYLARLKLFVKEFDPIFVSEHACFTSLNGHYFHDLLPVPYTKSAVEHFASRIHQIQEAIKKPILIENLSRYIEYPESEFTECAFLSQLCQSTGCGLLLDITNAYVNQQNLNIDAQSFMQNLPTNHIKEIHLAGFSENNGWLVDTHSSNIDNNVWDLYTKFCNEHGPRPTLIERDTQIPELHELMKEQNKAATILKECNQEHENKDKSERAV